MKEFSTTGKICNPLPPEKMGAQVRRSELCALMETTEAGELLPRIAMSPEFHECRLCDWQDRCWRLLS